MVLRTSNSFYVVFAPLPYQSEVERIDQSEAARLGPLTASLSRRDFIE